MPRVLGAAAALSLMLVACTGHADDAVAPEKESVVSSDCTASPAPGALAEALAAAAPGSVICLQPTVYSGTFVVPVGLTLRGPGATLDAGGAGPVLHVRAEKTSVRVEGVTLTGGFGHAGGAVPLDVRSEVVFVGCTFRGNEASDYGGGAIHAQRGKVVLEGCTVTGNSGRIGAALLADGVSLWEIRDTTITGNTGGRGALTIRDGANVAMSGGAFGDNTLSDGPASISIDGTTSRGPTVAIDGVSMPGGAEGIQNTSDKATVAVAGVTAPR